MFLKFEDIFCKNQRVILWQTSYIKLHQNFAENIFIEYCMKEDPCARIKKELTRLKKYSFRVK